MYGSQLSTEDELKNALDEISKVEKDMSLITVIAKTLFEKTQQQSESYAELEDAFSTCNVSLGQLEQSNDQLQNEVLTQSHQIKALEIFKQEQDQQIQQLKSDKLRLQTKKEETEALLQLLQDQASHRETLIHNQEMQLHKAEQQAQNLQN